MKYRSFKTIILLIVVALIPAGNARALVIEPENSFIVEFLPDGKLNLTTNLTVDEDDLADLFFRVGMDDRDIGEMENAIEESLAETFDEQMAEWRRYEGYPKHQAELADIEDYEIEGRSYGGGYHLRFKMYLRSMQYMKTLDPTFNFFTDDGGFAVSLMLHFPFPDISLGARSSTIELAPEVMQYIIVLPHPIENSRSELGDIPGFLSATAYSAAFAIAEDVYQPVYLTGRVGGVEFPSAVNSLTIGLFEGDSCHIEARINISKADLRSAVAANADLDIVGAAYRAAEEFSTLADIILPECAEYELTVEMVEDEDSIIYVVEIGFQDITQVNDCDGIFEYARVGDRRFITFPLSSNLDPSRLPLFADVNLRPVPIEVRVVMPGRICGSNSLRILGIPFEVDVSMIRFHVRPGDKVVVTVQSDTLGT